MKIKKYWVFLLISFFLVGCDSLLKVDFLKKLNQDVIASLKIGQSEVIGSCVFNSSSQNVNNTNFSYLLSFSKEINSAVVSTQTISNVGTGGATDLNWAIQDCGDGQNFKIAPTLIVGDGTIAPDVSNIIAAVSSPDKGVKLENDINQIVVNYDTQAPSISINQSSSENIGSCNFTGTNDPTNIAGFSYKITFSEKVNPATFLVSDITNTGTGAGSSLVWGLENCGDNQNFKLTANSLAGDGTVIPVISSGVLTDLAGNMNTISLSVDNSITYDTSSLLVNINQSITEVIGTCSFSAASDPTNVAGFSYKVIFSKNIDVSSFTTNDITNSGTSGDIGWSLGSCGDGKTFKLVADTIEFNGTIIPTLASGVVLDPVGSGNQSSTGIDNSVTFDNIRPSITINQATTETVGSCSFNAMTDPTHLLGFNYKIVFSENINTSSFTSGDIANNGTSGLVGWNLESCGDGRVFKLTASSVAIDGTVIPVVSVNSVSDLAGNLNTLSTATDNSVTYDGIAPNVTINQSVAETVGSCSFVATNDPTNVAGFSYKIHFLEAIDTGSFNISDISNIGTGGSTTLTWQLENCGDDQNFKLTANSVVGEGTIIPRIGANQVYDVAGNLNILSTSTDGSVTFDTTSPSVTINQSVAETVGSCSFVATNDPTNAAGFSYKVAFSEAVNAASFTVSDIVNNGTGGGTTLTWALASCGDNQHFKLTVNTVSGDGTIIPVVNAGGVSDVAGNLNTLSTATDNSITYDTISPGITISRSVVETVGSCSFTGTNATEGAAGFNFKVVFSEKINNSSFTVADVTNGGTGGATTLTWSLASCGDDQNYRLTVSAITGEGTVIPRILASRVTDVAGNQNTLSVSSNGTVTYQLLGWRQEAYIKSVNSAAGDNSGNSVSISGDTLAVGACRENSNATTITNGAGFSGSRVSTSSGAVYVYKRTGNTWAQEAYIKAINNGAGDNFGNSVSLSGDTLAVGAYYEDSDATTITSGASFSGADAVSNSGAVYVYKRTGVIWAQEAYVKPVNNSNNAYFGNSVSLSGNTLAVGANQESYNATTITDGAGFSGTRTSTFSGAVYVYKRTGSNWEQEAYIKAINNNSHDYFGSSVSISGDTLAVGATGEDSEAATITNGAGFSGGNVYTDSGAVYVYRNNARLFNTQDVFRTSASTTSLTLNWINSGFKTTGYFIAYAQGLNAPVDCHSGTIVDVGNSTSYTFNSLSAGTHYSFRICSYDSNANLSEGYVISFQTASLLPEPGDLSLSTVTPDREARITWTSAGGSVTGYRLVYQQNSVAPSTCNSGTIIDVGNVLTYQFTGLLTNTDYGVRVCSYDALGNLSIGKYIGIKTSLALNPINIYTISTAVTNDRLTVNWTNVSDRVTGFIVAWAAGSSAPTSCSAGTFIDAGNVTSYSITGLTAGASYGIRVCAYEAGGNNISLGVSLVGNVRNDGWVQEAYVKAVNNGIYDSFGYSISISGDTLAVGSFGEDSNATIITNGSGFSGTDVASNSDRGAVYVYKRAGTNWEQEAYVKAVNSGNNDRFGNSVSMSGDTLAVGAYHEGSNATTITNGPGVSGVDTVFYSGAVYVYKRAGTNWAQEAYIKAVNNGADDSFGQSVSISGDTLAVAVPNEDSNATIITNGTGFSGTDSSINSQNGAVYVYKRTGNNWAQEAYVKASNNGAGDNFGSSVSISGETLVVGAFYEDSNATTITNGTGVSGVDTGADNSGAVYVYKRTGSNWAQEAYIKAANSGSQDYFGHSVSISGETLAVGAYQEDSNATTVTNGVGFSGVDTGTNDSGAVYVYKRTGNNWAQEAYIKAVNSQTNDYFGSSVSISGDTLAVGAHQEDSNATTITNGTGFSGTDSSINSQNGAVYVYKRTGSSWAQEAYIKAVNNESNDYFGSSISISGDTLVVGAYSENSNATTITNGTGFNESGTSTGSGAVYIFRNNARLFAVTEIFPVVTSNSISLRWNKTGGTAVGYGVNLELGIVTPPLCSLSMDYDLGNNNELLLESLTADTDYSLRFCVYDGSNQFVEDKVINLKTNP